MNDTTQPQLTRPVSVTPLFVIGGAVIASIGALCPWARVSSPFGTQTSGPEGGGIALLLVLLAVAGVVGSKWNGRLSMPRRVGLSAALAVLAFFAVSGFASAGDAAQEASQTGDVSSFFGGPPTSLLSVSVGIGLYLYTLGLLVLAAGLFRSWFMDRDTAGERLASSGMSLVA